MGSAVTRHREKETVTRAPCIVSAKNARRIVNTPKYQVAAKSPAAPDIYTRRKDSHDTPALSSTGSGGDGMKIQMREKRSPLPPLVLPPSSCMVRSKYIPGTQNKQWAMSDTPPFAKEPVGAAKIVRVPLSAPVPPQATDDTFDLQSAASSCQGNDAGLSLGTLMGASGDAQGHVVAKEMPASVAMSNGKRSNPLMECSFDANGASSVGSAGPAANVQSFLPFVLPQNMDERSANNFIEYITQHALELRGPRDLLWFNVDYDRRLLRRRRERGAITWCPTEEIAIPETSEKSDETVTPPAPPAAARFDKSPQEVAGSEAARATTSPLEKASAPRQKSRPILADDVPHRQQLAKKALEDNFIFIHSCQPKF